MSQTRTPRDLETREKTMRPAYVPPSALPDPTPQPGISFRWVATHVMGQEDVRNVSLRMQDGWVPAKAADHPEMGLYAQSSSGNIEIGGLMLCKRPIERSIQAQEYFENLTQRQLESVDNHLMRENDHRVRKFNDSRSSSTRGSRFGSGS